VFEHAAALPIDARAQQALRLQHLRMFEHDAHAAAR
jgi:hypothetical protein